MRILSAAPLRHGALIEWEQSVTDETGDSGPARLHSGTLTHRQRALWGNADGVFAPTLREVMECAVYL